MADSLGKQNGPSRLWRTVLVVSLALNLAIAGLVVGAGVSGRFGDRPPRSFDFGLGPIARALKPEERHAIGSTMRRDDGLRRVNPRGNARAIIDAVRADPFDPVKLHDLLAAQSTQMAALQQKAQIALVDQIAAMSPDRRTVFANHLQQELLRGRERRDGRSGG